MEKCCLCGGKAKTKEKIVEWCKVQFFQPTPQFQLNDFAELKKKVHSICGYKGMCKNCLRSLAQPCNGSEKYMATFDLSNVCAYCHVTVTKYPCKIENKISCNLCYFIYTYRKRKAISFHRIFCQNSLHSFAECINFSKQRRCHCCSRIATIANVPRTKSRGHVFYCDQHIPSEILQQNDSETEGE